MMVPDTLLSQDGCTHYKNWIPTSNNMRNAPDTNILKTKSDVMIKVKVTLK